MNGRVRRLEGINWQCPECGWPPAPGEKVEIEVHWPDLDEDSPDYEPEREPEYCQVCGEPDEIIITW